MTNQQHPITPPLKLVEDLTKMAMTPNGLIDFNKLTALAARWGADQELEACCDVIARELIFDSEYLTGDLRTARRPKPPSLKEQALERCNDYIDPDGIIRRAINQLPDE